MRNNYPSVYGCQIELGLRTKSSRLRKLKAYFAYDSFISVRKIACSSLVHTKIRTAVVDKL